MSKPVFPDVTFSVKSRKLRLLGYPDIPVDLELDPEGNHTNPSAMKSPEPPLDNKATSPDSAEPVPSAESTAGSGDAETREKREAEKTADSTSAVSDVETADGEETDSTSCSAPETASLVQSKDENREFPRMDMNSFNAIKSLVLQFKLQQRSSTQRQQVTFGFLYELSFFFSLHFKLNVFIYFILFYLGLLNSSPMLVL